MRIGTRVAAAIAALVLAGACAHRHEEVTPPALITTQPQPPPPPSSPTRASKEAVGVTDPMESRAFSNFSADTVEELTVTGSSWQGGFGDPRGVVGGVVGGVLAGVAGGVAPGYASRYELPRQGASDTSNIEPTAGEGYALRVDNPFRNTLGDPVSTFGADVDRASYSNVRRFLGKGVRPPVDAVRIEELINYFSFDDPEPRGGAPVAMTAEAAPCPWKPQHLLLRIGVKARSIDVGDLPPCNLVFLIDVSGSMSIPNKLPLLKQAFGLLVDTLRPQDRVSIVVYAGAAGLVLEPTAGDRKDDILNAIADLQAGGSTAGGEGLRLAYDEAEKSRIEGGVNRVILATDGDFNVGESSDGAMVRLIEQKRGNGIFLTVLGFGEENLQDSKMEAIADHGDGHYAYVDSLMEARKVLVGEIGGTLATVARDVKIQVEFNPARVAGWRLIGYENRLLSREDFDDDTKDAGDMGAGHSVTALYELIPAGAPDADLPPAPEPLRYQAENPASGGAADGTSPTDGEMLLVRLRYKEPEGGASRLMEQPVADAVALSSEFAFAAAVAEFGLVLRESPYRGDADLLRAITVARGALRHDERGERAGFVQMAETAAEIQLQ